MPKKEKIIEFKKEEWGWISNTAGICIFLEEIIKKILPELRKEIKKAYDERNITSINRFLDYLEQKYEKK